MKIKEHIKELLITNQGVIIPGLGGFVSEYEPAAFDVNENKFLPPSKKIIFKSDYNYQDNLLIDFISKKETVQKNEVKSAINDFVKDCNSKLNKGLKVEFPEIGTLSKSGKSIIFKQSKEANLLSDSFGLQSIKTPPAEIKTSTKAKKSYKKVIILSSSILVFLILVGFCWYLTEGFTDFSIIASNNSSSEAVEDDEIINTERNLDSIAKADSLKTLINESIDENTDIKDALFYEEPDKEEPKSKYSTFQIIAGSFSRMDNANKFAEELKEKGYSPEIIRSGDNLFRISIFTYNDETEALKQLYKLRQTTDIKSVWILKSI